MYIDAIPKQYDMLSKLCCLVLPFFKQKTPLLKPQTLSSLNAFASIWCCIENILLAATAEGLACSIRIPLGEEDEHISEILQHPKEYFFPCYLSIGYPSPEAIKPMQIEQNIKEKIHYNKW
jgi:nitroreductase